MKKSKLLRKIAYPAMPQYADGFVPPAGYDHKIIVNLHNVDVKVYGFTGTQWEMIHNSDGVIDNYIGDVLHQKYYFESKNGANQDVRVSFLSTEEEAAELEYGTSDSTRKFHHIEEIPVYHGSDEGRMLTVMSDGSLRWLAAGESHIVGDSESNEGESGNPISWEGVFTLDSGATLYDDGAAGMVMTTNDTGFAYANWSSFLSNSNPDKIVVSFWFKSVDVPQVGMIKKLFGFRSGWTGVKSILTYNGSSYKLKSVFSKSSAHATPPAINHTFSFQHGEWHNIVMTLDKTVGLAKTYLNGQMVSELTGVQSSNWVAGDLVGKFGLGSDHFQSDGGSTSETFDFDSFQMVEGISLTDQQIADIYNDGTNREVVIS
jgi:hypothetical protein